MVAAESAGWATKNLPIGIDVPGVGPFAHVVPELFSCAEGTSTLYPLEPSRYRNGASRVTGLAANVVNVGLGKLCAGTLPVSPQKTWFQTALLQPSAWLLRARNCCCDPLTTVLPVNSESAMNPPLVNPVLQ